MHGYSFYSQQSTVRQISKNVQKEENIQFDFVMFNIYRYRRLAGWK